MELNKALLISFICFSWLSLLAGDNQLKKSGIGENGRYASHYMEAVPYVEIEPIPTQTVNSRFNIKVRVSEQIRKIYLNQDLAIAATLPDRDKNFYIYDFPQDAIEIISDQGGQWEWRVQALEAGEHTLHLNIGIVKSGPNNNLIIEDNSSIPIQVVVKNLPIYARIWNGIINNWISIVGWGIAIISIAVNIYQKRKS